MEQSLSETAAASSPPKKKRGRPKKADKPILLHESAAEAVSATATMNAPKVRRKRRKGSFSSKSVDSEGKSPKKTQQEMSSPTDHVDASTPSNKLEEAAADVKLGQKVHGVVDGTFDAGYLVTVRVGDTETVFRGVVFGPGLSLPLSRENDVAPKMKTMNRDDDDNPGEVAQSPVSLNEASPTALPQAPTNSASIPTPPASDAQRAVGSTGLTGFTHAPTPAPPNLAGTAGYSPGAAAYRSPSAVQSPVPQNASGGFFYPPPAYTMNPNGNHGPAYYPPRGFPAYPFQYISRAEYAGAGSPQFAADSAPAAGTASVSAPSPNVQGTGLPPRSS